MSLNNIIQMIKADRYTADGREEIKKALAEETEDRTYQIGEISQKTGLQKTANGWVKPKKGNNGSAKKDVSGTTKMTPEQKSKSESKPTDETDSAGNKRPSTDVAYLKGSKDPQLKADVKKAIATHHVTGNNLLNILYNKDKELYKKLDAMGTKNAEQFINQLASSESKPESKPETPSVKVPKPSVQEYMKAKDTVKKYDETYKKQLEEYETGQRLRANGGGAILDPMYGLKPNDLSKNENYMKAKEIIQRMEAKDAAPRVLTGDCKIRIRK